MDGFRVDAIGNLYEAEHLEDEPQSGTDVSPVSTIGTLSPS